MQELFIKCPDGHTKTVKVIRSFQDISGAHIFLHHDGTYGDRTGTPVRSESDLQALPPEHRRIALAWWNRTGKSQSKAHYDALNEKEAIRAGDFQEDLSAQEANSILDSILYARRPLSDGKQRGAVTSAKSWLEFGFSQRPDWWGQADAIKFKDFMYEMQAEPTNQTSDQNPDLDNDTDGV